MATITTAPIHFRETEPDMAGGETDWLARYDDVPASMAEKPNWLLYQLDPPSAPGKKPRKVPNYTNGARRSGKLGRPEDRGQLVTLGLAIAAARCLGQQKRPGAPGVAGLGFATFGDSGVTCVDLDGCISPDGSKHFNEHQRAIVEAAEAVGAMIERSPSGTGLHVWGMSDNRANGKANEIGVELFSTTGFVTVTCDFWGNCEFLGAEAVNMTGVVDLAQRTIRGSRAMPGDAPTPLPADKALEQYVQDETVEHLRSALTRIPADDRDVWVRIGQALKGLSSPSHDDAGRELFEEWSATSVKHNPEADASTWESFSGDRSGYRAVLAEAQRRGWLNPKSRVTITARKEGRINTDGQAHPLLNFTNIGDPLEAPSFVIPGFIIEGVLTIAGAPGVGKTTAMVPLALTAAGIHAEGDPLAPKHWRHVVYISEDVNQAKRILLGVRLHSVIDAPQELVAERFHLVPAHRMPVEDLVLVGMPYRERFTRVVDGVEVPPLIVIDTKSAVIASEEENSNSEASKAIALLKQQFADLPVWIIGHVAKTDANRTDAKTLSMRGGGAIEGDANQTAFLVNESGVRFLVLGKIRFEARWRELQIETHTAETVARDQWGDLEPLTLRWGRVTPPEVSRSVLKAQAKQATDETKLRAQVLEFVGSATGPINRTAIYKAVRGRRADAIAAVTALLKSGELIEQDTPRGERNNNNQRTRIVLGPMARSTEEGAS